MIDDLNLSAFNNPVAEFRSVIYKELVGSSCCAEVLSNFEYKPKIKFEE